MTTEMLHLAVLASMTVVAIMVAINSRGRWRATFSSLLAICLLGGTAWVFILQYSIKIVPVGRETPHIEPVIAAAEETFADCEVAIEAIIAQAGELAGELLRERLHHPSFSHAQLVARANDAGRRFEALRDELGARQESLANFPETAKLLEYAMTELSAANHFFHSYYFAENTAAEQSTERLLRQRARNAQDSLMRAARTLKQKRN